MHKVTATKIHDSLTEIRQDGTLVALVSGHGRGFETGMVYVMIAHDAAAPIDFWKNARPIARWKWGTAKKSRATKWCKAVFAAMTPEALVERLKGSNPTAIGQELGLANI